MPDDGDQRPQGPPEESPQGQGGQPEYRVYRSRRGIFSRLRGSDVPKSGDAAAAGGPGGAPVGPGQPGDPDEPGRKTYGRGHREGPSLPPLKLPWKRREE